MTPSETLIVVLVLLLIFSVMNYSKKSADPSASLKQQNKKLSLDLAKAKRPVIVQNVAAAPPPASSQDNAAMAERMSVMDNIESFSVCGGVDNETDRAVDCLCGDNPDITFSVHEFGAPGMDYKAFTATQEIDPEVVKNHGEFVAERQGMTGRTFTPDSHDSYDPIPWIGLRRPEYVKMCNPTQVPDLDVNLYKGNRQFCFKT
jgi:hypothetical protein